ncbi:MAG: ATP-binding cassette domain-containing protein [Methanomassiliicoccaceae archaeon]|nr:ATP-binding cassette domain-containing protein [Methanomassiliicoccaceae archaeon]
MNKYAVEFENVSLVRNSVRILDNVSLKIKDRESVAIIGPNGSGKTSLMKLMKGGAWPYYDENVRTICRLFGEDRWNIFDLRKKIGVVSMDLQSRFKDQTSVGAVVLSGFFRTVDIYRDHEITDEMVAAAEDAAARVGISDKLTRDISKLSLGEMRRALIARALVPGPKMLLLDEPMTSLDIVAEGQFKNVLDSLIKEGTGIVMITHDLEDIPKNVQRIIMIKNGRIFKDGNKKELLTSNIMSDLFSSAVEVNEENGMYRMRAV